jgi:hypothetical protein
MRDIIVEIEEDLKQFSPEMRKGLRRFSLK